MEKTFITNTVKNTPAQHRPSTRVQPVHRPVFQTEGSQVTRQTSRLAQSGNKVGHNTASELMETPDTKEKVDEDSGTNASLQTNT